MIRPLVVAALLSPLPTASSAQSPICDGSEMRRLEQRRRLGGTLALGTLAANALVFGLSVGSPNPEAAPASIEKGRRAMGFAVATLPIVAVGAYIYAKSYPDERFWGRALAGMKIGETTSSDVATCLLRPSATSISAGEEKWTYLTTRSDGWLSEGSLRSVSFTFRNGVLAELRRSEINLPQGWTSTEPVPVIVPVP